MPRQTRSFSEAEDSRSTFSALSEADSDGRPNKRRRVDLNTKFSRMMETMKSIPSSRPSPAAPHLRALSNTSSVTEAFNGLDEARRLGREFSLIKMKPANPPPAYEQCTAELDTSSNASHHKDPLPSWLQSTISQLASHHPLRVILPPNHRVLEPGWQKSPDLPAVDQTPLNVVTEEEAISLGEREEDFAAFLPQLFVQNDDCVETRASADSRPISALNLIAPSLSAKDIQASVLQHAFRSPYQSRLISQNIINTGLSRSPNASFLEQIATAEPVPLPFSTPGPLHHSTILGPPIERRMQDSVTTNYPVLDTRLDHSFSPAQTSPYPLKLLSTLKTHANIYSSDDDLATDASSSLLTNPSLFNFNFGTKPLLHEEHVSSGLTGLSPNSLIAAKTKPVCPIRVYFDSPLEDPTSSDPMEPDEYELFKPDLEKLDFHWMPFDRKSLGNSHHFYRDVKTLIPPQIDHETKKVAVEDGLASPISGNKTFLEEAGKHLDETSWGERSPSPTQRQHEPKCTLTDKYGASQKSGLVLTPAAETFLAFSQSNIGTREVLPSTPRRNVVEQSIRGSSVNQLDSSDGLEAKFAIPETCTPCSRQSGDSVESWSS